MCYIPVSLFSSSIEKLIAAVEEMSISDEQRSNMQAFLEEKVEILKQGEMKESQFETLAELGFGNGGVVLKVKHKPSSTVMARKVKYYCMCIYAYNFNLL